MWVVVGEVEVWVRELWLAALGSVDLGMQGSAGPILA